MNQSGHNVCQELQRASWKDSRESMDRTHTQVLQVTSPIAAVLTAMRLAKREYAGDVTALHYTTLRSQQGGGPVELLLLGEQGQQCSSM